MMVKQLAATVYLSLGSNLGDREGNLQKAVEILGERLKLSDQSPIYQTDPVGGFQPKFLNMAVKAVTRLAPNELLLLLKGVERQLGRQPGQSGLPRTIDIDIIFFDEEISKTSELEIPHPRAHQRAFVLVPLCDIDSEIRHPVLNKTISQLLRDIDSNQRQTVKRWKRGQEDPCTRLL
jgi:2-amino-4-hydroxy-6-hydroxymethyldihydropteridine diphosphokinase